MAVLKQLSGFTAFSGMEDIVGRLEDHLSAARKDHEPVIFYETNDRLRGLNHIPVLYEAISKSSDIADSGPFIEFMLEEILAALKAHQGTPIQHQVSEKEQLILDCIMAKPDSSAKAISEKTGISDRQIERLMASLKDKGILARSGSRKSGRWIVNLMGRFTYGSKSIVD